MHVVLAHGAGGQRDAGREGFALEASAGDGDMHVLDGDAGHALGGIDGRADAGLDAVEMGDHAGLQTFGAGSGRSRAPRTARHRPCPRTSPARRSLGDQAADLARADVERGNDALALASYRGRVSHPPALNPRVLTSCLRPAQPWCSPSDVSFAASAPGVVADAPSRSRTVTRSSSRRSIGGDVPLEHARGLHRAWSSELSASSTLSSGSMMSSPEASCSVQRRSPTLMRGDRASA